MLTKSALDLLLAALILMIRKYNFALLKAILSILYRNLCSFEHILSMICGYGAWPLYVNGWPRVLLDLFSSKEGEFEAKTDLLLASRNKTGQPSSLTTFGVYSTRL